MHEIEKQTLASFPVRKLCVRTIKLVASHLDHPMSITRTIGRKQYKKYLFCHEEDGKHCLFECSEGTAKSISNIIDALRKRQTDFEKIDSVRVDITGEAAMLTPGQNLPRISWWRRIFKKEQSC